MSFQDKLEKFEQSQGTIVDDPATPPTESVETPPAPPAEEPPAEPITTPPAEVPPVDAPPATPPVVEPDYNKFVEESSGGLLKTVDDFKTSVDKIKGYDELLAQKTKLETDLGSITPFAKKYDELVKAGKTQDQIKSFIKINELGDLAALDPFDIKVEKLVQDGWKRDVAARYVTQQFGLDIDVEGEHLSEEQKETNMSKLEDAKEILRMSSKSDLADLEALKVSLSDTTDNDANNKILADVAQTKEYNEKLAPVAKQIASAYSGVSELNINGKEGAEAKTMNFDIEPEFKKTAEKWLNLYFKDGKIPVNDQTVAEAKMNLDAVWLSQNKEKFAQTIYNQGIADAKDKADNEYENRSGLPVNGLAPIAPNAEKDLRAQQKVAARGED